MPKRTNDGVWKRCDCGKRRWPKCEHPWYFNFHAGGHSHRYSLDAIARARGQEPPTTKVEAMTWRDQIRGEIRAGTFADPDAHGPAAPPEARLTFGDVCDQYLARHVRTPTRRPRGRREMEIMIKVLRRAEIPGPGGAGVRLEAKAIDAITRADVEAVRTWRRQEQAARKSKPGAKGGEVGTNRLLSRLRHVFAWAIAEGHIEATPFKRGSVSVVRMETTVEDARTRRLEPSVKLPDGTVEDGDEARLLAHAGPHLRALIVAALSTGARLGELLSLQWSQIRRDEHGQARWLVLPAAKTKTAEGRVIPVGSNLRATLELRKHAPDGTERPADAYVFGTDTGARVKSIRTAWTNACEKAGITGLHFHDLRREFAAGCSSRPPTCTMFRCSSAMPRSRPRAATCRARQIASNKPSRGSKVLSVLCVSRTSSRERPARSRLVQTA
jgi:integrase